MELAYMPNANMIADGLTKLLTYTKFHTFIDQIYMT